MWFVPTRNRPERLQRFLDGCIATGMIMPGLIVVDGEDGGDYSSVKLPLNWKIETASVRIDAGGRQECYFRSYPDAKFYSIVNDDVVPETPKWDVELALEAGDWNVAYPWDTLSEMATQFLVGGKLCHAVGSFSLGFMHTMVDRAWMDIGAALGRLKFRKDIRLRHEHWSRGLAPRDATYKRELNGVSTIAHDRARYAAWKTEEFPALIAHLKTVVPFSLGAPT